MLVVLLNAVSQRASCCGPYLLGSLVLGVLDLANGRHWREMKGQGVWGQHVSPHHSALCTWFWEWLCRSMTSAPARSPPSQNQLPRALRCGRNFPLWLVLGGLNCPVFSLPCPHLCKSPFFQFSSHFHVTECASCHNPGRRCSTNERGNRVSIWQ